MDDLRKYLQPLVILLLWNCALFVAYPFVAKKYARVYEYLSKTDRKLYRIIGSFVADSTLGILIAFGYIGALLLIPEFKVKPFAWYLWPLSFPIFVLLLWYRLLQHMPSIDIIKRAQRWGNSNLDSQQGVQKKITFTQWVFVLLFVVALAALDFLLKFYSRAH
jgi:hypothetical protein